MNNDEIRIEGMTIAEIIADERINNNRIACIRVGRLRENATRMERRISKLEAALKPFALLVGWYAPNIPNSMDTNIELPNETWITVGQVRTAAALLQSPHDEARQEAEKENFS